MGKEILSGISSKSPAIVVAGDVCIDWLSVPMEPVPADVEAGTMNWQLRHGHHMYAVPGGAWLTGKFLKTLVEPGRRVLIPEEMPQLEIVPPDQVIHSMLWLDHRKNDKAWVVRRFEGFAGPLDGKTLRAVKLDPDEASANVVVLDDAGNGFRERKSVWPDALTESKTPWVLLKVRSPLLKGTLWKHLKAHHLDRTIVLLSADDLRVEGANISKRLSWERTATDIVACVARDPDLIGLGEAAYCVITLGIEGAVLIKKGGQTVMPPRLWYIPASTEGQTLAEGDGDMTGFGSIFTASVAAAVANGAELLKDNDLHAGILHGLESMSRLLARGLGSGSLGEAPAYPLDAINNHVGCPKSAIHAVDLPALPGPTAKKANHKYRAWRILDSIETRSKWKLATEVALHGLDKVFPTLPIGRFKKLEPIDRSELESYRTIRNLIREFIRIPKPERPLSLAVFGPPGSGKSFGIKQVANSVTSNDEIEMIEFNLSQWENPSYLVQALHRVRDIALRGKVPLVFFDEFDSRLGTQELGWLRYFLAPMQDGVFADGTSTHQVGKAIFIFAGGTAKTFAEFEARQRTKTEALVSTCGDEGIDQQAKDAKLPDFLSRVRGHVDVFGFSPPCDTNLIRRAALLRSMLVKKCPDLFQSDGLLRIDAHVLRAFLQVPEYRHGARSMEALLDISSLLKNSRFDSCDLPPLSQLDLHVDGRAFQALLSQYIEVEDHRDDLAKKVHENYRDRELKRENRQGSIDSVKPWAELGDLEKTSNYEQVSYYPTLLAAVNCNIAPAAPNSVLKFTPTEIDCLARMEHERWMEERRIKQPDHPDLIPWAELPEDEKQKDRCVITDLPEVLAMAKLCVTRVI
jgi:ATPase family associated with various cellular activities (AAA)